LVGISCVHQFRPATSALLAPENVTMNPRRFADLFVGQSIVHAVNISNEMISAYADVVGDHNPIHTNAEYATPRFGGIIAHGTLLVGLCSAGVYELLGPGVVARTFKSKFKAPMRPGDKVIIEIRIIKLVPKIRKVVVEGKAHVGSTLVATTVIEALSEA
jgi:3-hydroxybutyryl-CoA dehydratase